MFSTNTRQPQICSLALMTLGLLCISSSDLRADIVVLGDAEVEFFNDGTINFFEVNGQDGPLSFLDHFVTIDGSAPMSFFALESSGADVNGNRGSVDLVYNDDVSDIFGIRVEIELTNPQDGDLFAGVDYSIEFMNLSDNALDLRYYSYQDYDLDFSNPSGDTASFDGTTMSQQHRFGTTGRDIEVTSTTDVDHWELNEAANIYDQLSGAESPIDLADGTNGLETDIEFAMQYNLNLGAGSSSTIEYSLDFTPPSAVPEIGTSPFISCVGLIVAAAFWIRRRRLVRQQ